MRDGFVAGDGDATSEGAGLGAVDLESLVGGVVDELEEGHGLRLRSAAGVGGGGMGFGCAQPPGLRE